MYYSLPQQCHWNWPAFVHLYPSIPSVVIVRYCQQIQVELTTVSFSRCESVALTLTAAYGLTQAAMITSTYENRQSSFCFHYSWCFCSCMQFSLKHSLHCMFGRMYSNHLPAVSSLPAARISSTKESPSPGLSNFQYPPSVRLNGPHPSIS